MVSKGQFVGLDWNRITRLHSQVMIGTQEVKNSLTASRCHLKAYPRKQILTKRFFTDLFSLKSRCSKVEIGHLAGQFFTYDKRT